MDENARYGLYNRLAGESGLSSPEAVETWIRTAGASDSAREIAGYGPLTPAQRRGLAVADDMASATAARGYWFQEMGEKLSNDRIEMQRKVDAPNLRRAFAGVRTGEDLVRVYTALQDGLRGDIRAGRNDLLAYEKASHLKTMLRKGSLLPPPPPPRTVAPRRVVHKKHSTRKTRHH
jgi:hypothetical protein